VRLACPLHYPRQMVEGARCAAASQGGLIGDG
jgi:hypothetical protein